MLSGEDPIIDSINYYLIIWEYDQGTKKSKVCILTKFIWLGWVLIDLYDDDFLSLQVSINMSQSPYKTRKITYSTSYVQYYIPCMYFDCNQQQ